MKILNIIVGVFYLIFGLFLWNHPLDTIATYSIAFGITQLSTASALLIYSLYKKVKPIPWGNILVSLAIGLSMFLVPFVSLIVILWIFIFSFLSMSIFHLQSLLRNRDQKWYMIQIALAVLGIIYSFIMLLNPIVGFATIAKILAFGVITNGLSYIFSLNKN